jgi:hypothetical protein
MSDPGPYVRDALLATRAGLTDPALLVDLWLDRFLGLLAPGTSSGLAPEVAYDLTALFGRLLRCRPALVAATGRGSAWDAAVSAQGHPAVWLPLALRVPDPEGWLAEAVTLAGACDDAEPEDELAEWAEQLLTDLDDAELVAWAARREGVPDTTLEEGLTRCDAWLRRNLDRFFPAGVFVQGLGQTIRPDLPGLDLGLAATADKLVVLLDALEDMQECLGSPRLAPTILAESWQGFPEPTLALAAATAGAEGLFRRIWRSPSGAFEARLAVGPERPGADRVRVVFAAGDEAPAVLVGQSAWLAGLEAVIDVEGVADFPRKALLAAWAGGELLSLRVGEERQVWRSVREE